jgi:NAD-dependent dihydropyrimidine dehydrogenase PreA subunit
MAKTKTSARFTIIRDEEKCIKCQVCVRMCAFDTHSYDEDTDIVLSKDENCVGCCFCVEICPTNALKIIKNW